MGETPMKHTNSAMAPLFAAALLCAPLLFAAQSARAETDVYRDVLRPNGFERSQAEKDADGRACGASADNQFSNVPKFEKCMRAHGWAFDHSAPDASDVPGATYDDLWGGKKGERGNAVLHADSRKCDPSGTADPESPEIKQCMLKRGWRLSFNIPDPNAADNNDPNKQWNPLGDHNVYTDMTRRKRSDAEVAAAAAECREWAGPDLAGVPTSPAMKQCMAKHGWRFDHTEGQTTWIDPETGLTCHSEGIAAVCSNF
jgi:hypothetical protein